MAVDVTEECKTFMSLLHAHYHGSNIGTVELTLWHVDSVGNKLTIQNHFGAFQEIFLFSVNALLVLNSRMYAQIVQFGVIVTV